MNECVECLNIVRTHCCVDCGEDVCKDCELQHECEQTEELPLVNSWGEHND